MGAEFEKQVSVIMGVYNQWNREALQKAVKSILNQTLTDFEFIIYDDGSDPEVAGYIRELEKLDERIVLIGKEENHGLAFSLNMCIGAAKGKYIARMDADDIALPERLQVQYDFMEQHKEYAWCGCNTRLFDENGIWGERKMPEFLVKLGAVLPAAIMAVLIVYCLKDIAVDWKANALPKILAVLTVGISYKWKHNTLISIAAGTAIYMVLIRMI